MSVREILQYELWSKKTSRRILLGGLVVALMVMTGLKAWQIYEFNWLSDGERKAARVALARIDELRTDNPSNYDDLKAMNDFADSAIAAADAKAVTERDAITSMQLRNCEFMLLVKVGIELRPGEGATKEQLDARAKLLARFAKLSDSASRDCEALHNALN